MKRVFLDANILFSAAWHEGSGISALWQRPDVQLVTSPYALMEAQHNIGFKKPSAAARLSQLAGQVEISSATRTLKSDHGLPEKDRPILEAAAGSGCLVLLTGDIRDFGHLMEKETEGVRVLTVSMFMAIFSNV